MSNPAHYHAWVAIEQDQDEEYLPGPQRMYSAPTVEELMGAINLAVASIDGKWYEHSDPFDEHDYGELIASRPLLGGLKVVVYACDSSGRNLHEEPREPRGE